MKRLHFALGVLFVHLSAVSDAQNAYRCGRDGRIYQETPCEQGEAIDLTDRRSAEQRRVAGAVAKREAQLAMQLEQDRLEREAATVPTNATGINGQLMPKASAKRAKGNRHKKGRSSSRARTHRSSHIRR